MKMKGCTRALFVALTVLALAKAGAQTNLLDVARDENRTTRSAESGFAEEEFRRGVQSYYRGSFNESILEFEKALSYLPGEPLVLEWLGKAYYRSGIEGAALQQWNYAVEAGHGGLLLQNRIEIVSDRRVTDSQYGFAQHFTESGAFESKSDKNMIFSQPISSVSNPDGTIWVAAYGSNEILKFDVNGVAVQRNRGPINGFDRPTDIIRLKNGNLAVAESAGDRVAILDANGFFIKYVGSKGTGDGQMVGPQFLAEDEFSNLYVTDFGNCRVVVFDAEGGYLFSFGKRTHDFDGLKSPTGIAVDGGRVFVADSVKGGVYEFDKAGNYVSPLVNDKTFARPESLKNSCEGFLLLADGEKVYSIDCSSGEVFENATVGKGSRLTSAQPDRNGNMIVTDIKGNEIYVMSKMTELVGGFFVQFERVFSDNFPEVTVEVRVENRKRQPVVGLKKTNFLITENKRAVADFELTGEANNNDFADITVLVDRHVSMKTQEVQLSEAVREIAASMEGRGRLTIVSAGKVPVEEYSGDPRRLNEFSASALKNGYSDEVALDLALRLCANGLVNAEKKRGVIFVTAGDVSQNAFTQYSLSDLSAYFNNNAISFSAVTLSQSALAQEVAYIADNTNGSTYYVYRPEGLGDVVKDIVSLPSGLYQFKYTSSLSTDYGRKYLPVEVEAYLLNRSGRDETGYFAPLQ